MRETERDLIFIGIRQLDVLTFYPRSHDLSVSRDKVSIHEIFGIRFLSIFNYDSTCDLTDVAAYLRYKIAVGPLDTIHDILRNLSLAHSLIKGQNVPIRHQRKSRRIPLASILNL